MTDDQDRYHEHIARLTDARTLSVQVYALEGLARELMSDVRELRAELRAMRDAARAMRHGKAA